MCLVHLVPSHDPPSEILQQHIFEIIKRLSQLKEERLAGCCRAILKCSHSLLLTGAFTSHDVFHDLVTFEIFAHENQMMTRTSASLTLESERQNIFLTSGFDGRTKLLDDCDFSLRRR